MGIFYVNMATSEGMLGWGGGGVSVYHYSGKTQMDLKDQSPSLASYIFFYKLKSALKYKFYSHVMIKVAVHFAIFHTNILHQPFARTNQKPPSAQLGI